MSLYFSMPASLGVGENLCSRIKAGLRELNVEVQGRVSNGTGSKHNEELQNFFGLIGAADQIGRTTVRREQSFIPDR
jgi:hypothetical protein